MAAHDWHALLADVPLDWALIPLDGHKRPIDPATGKPLAKWNHQPGFDLDALAAMNGSVRAVGVLLGQPSGGLLAVDFDGAGASSKFQEITGHAHEELPPTIAVTSGRRFRQQQFFSVDPDWVGFLRPSQHRNGSGQTVLEFRWNGQQSAIAGDHPETAGYRWCDGRSPSDVGLAPAPDWLLQAVVDGGPQAADPPPPPRSNSDDAQRAVEMLRAMSPADFEGYDDWLRVGMALHGTDPGLLSAWVDWCRPMANFDEAECLAKWEGLGRYPGRPVGIATLHHLAKTRGTYREPQRTTPATPSHSHRDAVSAGAQQQRPLTVPGIRDRLREAIAEGASGADLATLIAELSDESGQPSTVVRHLADALRTEQLQAAGVTAEAQQLAAELDRQQIGRALTPAFLLPPAIAAAIDVRVRYLPCDGPSAVLPFLTAVAGLVKLGTRVEGSAAAGYSVPVNLFSCLVGRSGAKKSPVGRSLVEAPLKPLVEDLAAANDREHRAWAESSQALPKGAPRSPEPHPKRIYVSDYTGEALAAQLRAQEAAGLGLLITRDEINGLFSGLNAYRGGRGADEQQLLELFDGGGMTSLRVTGDRHYSRSQCSIYGTTQPEVLRGLVADGDATGLWARFLFAPLPHRVVPLPLSTTPEEVAEVEAAAQALAVTCSAIYRLPPRTYRLATDAAQAFAHYEANRQASALKATIGAQSALHGKSAGKVLRIAGVLHLLQIAAGCIADVDRISADTLNRATAFVDHLDAWALSLHAEVANGGVGGVLRIVHQAAESAGGAIRWKEVQNRLTKAQRKEIDCNAFVVAAQALASNGYGEVLTGQRNSVVYRALAPLP